MEEGWIKRGEGGTVIGGVKIYALKYADDVALVADTGEGLRDMIRELEKYVKRNDLEINIEKTKVVIFSKGGRQKKEKGWEINGKKVEVVKDFKYLGVYFSTGNTFEKQLRMVEGKIRKAANAAWGIAKRARVGRLTERLRIAEAIARSGLLYGVEVWGWKRRERVERAQARYTKMAMGLRRNTPEYIWKMESGSKGIDTVMVKRAAGYISKILEMEEGRWPRVCLMEEARGLVNNDGSKWAKQLNAAMEQAGEGQVAEILRGGNKEEWRKKSGRAVEKLEQQELQRMWGKILSSNFCREYKERKRDVGMEEYWDKGTVRGETREIWARMRCRSVGREAEKGFRNTRCRVCGGAEETLAHVWEIQNLLLLPDLFKKSEAIEKDVNQHFAHLHGVLQNIESRLIYNLQEQCGNVTKHLNDIQGRLNIQESQLQSALLMAANTKDIVSRMNLRDIIPKLEKLADAPCHFARNEFFDTQNIVLHTDRSITAILENHCKIDIPEVAICNLLREETLPKGFDLEPFSAETSISNDFMDDSLLSESSIMKRASSCQSLASHESDNRPLREGGISLVKICHIEHPSNFYVRRVSYEQKSAELNEMLHNYASQTDSIPDDVKQNTLYAVKHELSDKWYRGRINSVNTNDDESDTYEVFDVDSGSTEHQVPKERLRNITKPLAMPAPMVLNCALFDIVPKNGKWTSEACQALAKYQEPSESVVMHVVKIQGHTLCVDLSKGHLRNNCPSIRDHLIYSDCGAFNTAHQLLRMTPRAVRRFYREDMALNSYHNVKVTHVESPECIYVQKVEDHSNYLDNMSAEMNAYYIETIKSDDGIIHVPEIGIACAAEEAEGVWRRAIITETTGSRKVTVILVDFGPTITVDYEKIRKLPENFMTASTQAIKVSLSDIKPINEQWTGDAEALISQHFQLAFGQLFAFERHDDVYTVVLYTSNEINVAALLVAKSLAISTGPRSAGRTEAPISPPKTHNSTNKVRNTRTAKKNARKRRARDSKNLSPEETNDPFKLRVKIIRVVSPDTIYVADPSNDASYDSMTAEMQRFYKKNAHIPTNSEWKINNQCAVYSARDGLFCRGKIVGFKNPESAEVFLYDLSFTEIIPIAELQALKKKFWATRTYAFSVKLAGIYPCGGSLEWLATSCLKLKEIIAKNEGAKFYISKVDSSETNDLDVELWVERVKIDGPLAPARIEINSINRELVETGLALPMKLYNEKKTNILAAELKRYISCVDDDKKAEEIQTNELFQEKEGSIDRDSTSEMSSAEDTMISILSISSNHEDNVTVLPSVVTLISNGDSSADQALVPTTEKPTAWLSAEPITDDVFTAMPTSLDNDGCLYLHSIRQSAQTLRYIEKTLAEKYDKTEAQERNRVWEKGEICIAQYHANSKWYRAQVHRMLDNNMIEVEFIDYGNIEECEDYKVRKDVALVNIPRQGTKCVIYGLFPNTETGKWNISDLDRIHALLIERECEISVLGRQPDHLEVSVILTNQKRCDLITYLRRDLHMNVRTARAISESSSDKSNTTMNGDEDVIIDGYIKDDEVLQEAGNNDIVGSGDTEHNAEDTDEEQKIIEKKNEACYEGGDFEESEKDSNHNDNSDNEEHEEHDYLEIEYIAMDSSVRAEMPTLTSIPKSKSIILANEEDPDNQDSETFADNENSTYVNNDPIIAGTANFTCSADEIEIHQRVAMGELDCISLPDTLSLIDGEILTSTPHNVTFDVHSLHWRLVEIPEEVQVVKAEVGKIGLLNLCMHLLDNKSSKILMDQRKQYDRIMLEMQAHANDQPLWEMTDKDSPCCAKFTDGVWYRCQVLDYALEPCQSGYTIQVRFVDYGNEAYVGSDEVRILKEEWFEAPCMSLYCNLWNVTLAPVDDFEIACAKIRSVYANKSDMENQSSLAFYVKIKGRLNQTYDVEIYRDEECTELVYQSIIDEGLYVKATNL